MRLAFWATLVAAVAWGAPPAARVAASIAILDRGHGRPVQAIAGGDGGPLVVRWAGERERGR